MVEVGIGEPNLFVRLLRIKERTPNNRKNNRRTVANTGSRTKSKRSVRTVGLYNSAIPFTTVPRRCETKYVSIPLHTAFHSIGTAAGTSAPLNNVIQGTEYYGQRIGRNVLAKHLSIHGVLVGGQTNTNVDDSYNVVRMVVATYNSSVAAPFTNLTLDLVLDDRDAAFPGLIKVLFDKFYVLSSPGGDTVGYLPATKPIKIDIPLDEEIQFNTVGVNSTSPTNIIIAMVTDSAAVPNPGFVSGTEILSYSDL
jgi:hypothetical protein